MKKREELVMNYPPLQTLKLSQMGLPGPEETFVTPAKLLSHKIAI